MEIPKKVVEKVNAVSVKLHCKVCDSGSYELLDSQGKTLAELNDEYVPSFFPDEHYGDYLILNIDLETGNILNWKKPEPEEVSKAFKIISDE